MARIMKRSGTLLVLGLLVLSSSLALRIWHRGPYLSGWDFHGAAEGACLWATRTPGEILDWLWANHRQALNKVHWHIYGVPCGLVPGFFAYLWPWRYWPQVVVAIEGTLALVLLRSVTGGSWVMLVWAVAGLGAMQSWLITGFAYLSSWFPHVVALWVVLRARRWWAQLLGGLLAVELPWHGQDLGHTVFVPLFAGAVLLPAPRWHRVWWAACGAAALYLVANSPTDSYQAMTHFGPVTWRTDRWQWPDLPLLPLLGLVAAWSLVDRGWFWRVVLGFQWLLVLGLLAASFMPFVEFPVGLWPRRFLLTEFYTVAVLLCWSREAGTASTSRYAWLPAGVALAAVLQLGVTVRWALHPLREQAGRVWPLPYSEAGINGMVVPARTEAVLDWIARAKRGERLDLDYGWTSQPDENIGDPQAALHQLYLAIGHEAFQRQVHLRQASDPRKRFGAGCLPDGAP